MGREFEQKTFFDHSRFANTHYASMLPVEFFLGNVLMRGDLQRVQYSSENNAFRKRFILNDSRNGGDIEKIEASNLNFPFVTYWYDGGPEPDDRPFAVQPMQMLRGTWEYGLPDYVKALAIKQTLTCTAFYSRDDDARLAYEMMLWEQQPKGPVQLATTLEWKGTHIEVPVFVTIEDLKFNPEYTEEDWLTSQRILPIKFTLTVRTYSVFMQPQEYIDGDQRNSSYGIGVTDLGENQESLYISEEVILNFAAAKQWGSLDVEETEDMDLDVEDPYTEEEQETLIADPREITTDIVRGYFSPHDDVNVNACFVDEADITSNGFTMRFQVKPSDFELFDYMKILIRGHEPVYVNDAKQKSVEVTGLYPNSDYAVNVLFYSISGDVTDFRLSVQTKEDESDPVQRPLRRRMGQLKGMEW